MSSTLLILLNPNVHVASRRGEAATRHHRGTYVHFQKSQKQRRYVASCGSCTRKRCKSRRLIGWRRVIIDIFNEHDVVLPSIGVSMHTCNLLGISRPFQDPGAFLSGAMAAGDNTRSQQICAPGCQVVDLLAAKMVWGWLTGKTYHASPLLQ